MNNTFATFFSPFIFQNENENEFFLTLWATVFSRETPDSMIIILLAHRSENWDEMADDDLFTRVTSIVGTDVGGLTERIKKLDMDFDFLRQVDV